MSLMSFSRCKSLCNLYINATHLCFSTDVSQLEGYQDIPDDCPAWKRAMIERKNKQLEEQIRVGKTKSSLVGFIARVK